VGAAGNYMSTTTACEEVTHQPDNDDIWACASCGYDAAGSEFEKQLV
jgi:ribosomal protein L37AE/L43A